MTGIDIVHVPYKGAAPAMNDLIAGHIPILFDNMPAVLPQVQGGAYARSRSRVQRARRLCLTCRQWRSRA